MNVEGDRKEECQRKCDHYAMLASERDTLLTAMDHIAGLVGAKDDGVWSVLGVVGTIEKLMKERPNVDNK